MDFNAKRLALLAGVGEYEDRHEIVQESAQQLNEAAEERQVNEAEDQVRKAVRRTIQKMLSEGSLSLGKELQTEENRTTRRFTTIDNDVDCPRALRLSTVHVHCPCASVQPNTADANNQHHDIDEKVAAMRRCQQQPGT